MKIRDIKAGERYAVSVTVKQAQNLPRGASFYNGLMEATALGIETNDQGRKVVRVEVTCERTRREHREEDHLDGTRTIWHGVVVDEHGHPVKDELRFEALITPQQVHETWKTRPWTWRCSARGTK
jgi:hypothetical protein